MAWVQGNKTRSPIWDKLQGEKDKEDAQAVLTKHFEQLSAGLEDTLNIYFSDRLVEDLIKQQFLPGKEPDYNSTHLGVSILAVIPASTRT